MTENETRGMRTMTVQWHPDAVARAVEHARAMLDEGIDDVRIVRGATNLPLTWQDVAVFVDLAAALERERIDFASNSATLDHVRDRLTDVLLDYDKHPADLAAAVDDIRTTVDTLAWLHAEALHHAQLHRAQAEAQRENESQGYLKHRAELIDALGSHAEPMERTLMRLITEDVATLREAYDTVEAELIEWRTGQRSVEASAAQWVEIQSTLGETLAAVQQLASHLANDTEHEQVSGELPTEAPEFPHVGQRAFGTDLDGRTVLGTITGFFCWNHETRTNDRARMTLDDETQTVVTTTSLRPVDDPEPVRFTHDTED